MVVSNCLDESGGGVITELVDGTDSSGNEITEASSKVDISDETRSDWPGSSGREMAEVSSSVGISDEARSGCVGISGKEMAEVSSRVGMSDEVRSGKVGALESSSGIVGTMWAPIFDNCSRNAGIDDVFASKRLSRMFWVGSCSSVNACIFMVSENGEECSPASAGNFNAE